MRRTIATRIAVLLILTLLCAVSSLQAASGREDREPGRGPAAVSAIWDSLGSLGDFFASLWSANGCEADPNGRCLPQPAAPQTDNGCEFDPSGHCGA